jgi:cold shock CspA family protein
MSSSNEIITTVYHGRVKWFNNKAGYGFITIIDGPTAGDKVGMDVFSHHSAICVSEEQYKYLVQGEYVEFVLSTVESGKDYKYQSANIRGVNGGNLLCETRNANRSTRPRRRNQTNETTGSVQNTGVETSNMSIEKPTLLRSVTIVQDNTEEIINETA